jgi:molybdopterin/thiamine biosynthesis adenylyltransferase
VLLFGAGRNGSAIAYQLVALGVQALTIVDPDQMEMPNLDAAFAFTEQDVGEPKAMALQRRLLAFRSDCAISSIPRSVSDAAVIQCSRGADLIVSCVDRDAPRLAASLLANRFLKVHLDVGTGITATSDNQVLLAGDARLLLPRQGCVNCVGGLTNPSEARRELLTPSGANERRIERPWHEQRAGSLITLNALTVSVGVQLWLDLLAGQLRTSHWHRLRWESGAGLQSDYARVEGLADCSVCGTRQIS